MGVIEQYFENISIVLIWRGCDIIEKVILGGLGK